MTAGCGRPAGPDSKPQDEPGPAAGTWMARHVQRGWHMPGVGVIDTVTTHTGQAPGQASVTFSGPQGHRTFGLDTLVQASEPAPAGQSGETR